MQAAQTDNMALFHILDSSYNIRYLAHRRDAVSKMNSSQIGGEKIEILILG